MRSHAQELSPVKVGDRGRPHFDRGRSVRSGRCETELSNRRDSRPVRTGFSALDHVIEQMLKRSCVVAGRSCAETPSTPRTYAPPVSRRSVSGRSVSGSARTRSKPSNVSFRDSACRNGDGWFSAPTRSSSGARTGEPAQ